MLANSKAGDVLKELKFLKENKIRMHVQIVLCPGYNDDKELQRTIRDPYGFYPTYPQLLLFRLALQCTGSPDLSGLKKKDASKALDIIDSFQKRFRKKHGVAVVYSADELYIKGGVNFLH